MVTAASTNKIQRQHRNVMSRCLVSCARALVYALERFNGQINE